jgi:hypothetical protein
MVYIVAVKSAVRCILTYQTIENEIDRRLKTGVRQTQRWHELGQMLGAKVTWLRLKPASRSTPLRTRISFGNTLETSRRPGGLL